LERSEDVWNSFMSRDVPEPALTDRATAAALIAAFASGPVQASHAAWRQAADNLDMSLKAIDVAMTEDGDPYASVPKDWMKELTEDLHPKERAARQTLAAAVAAELGHR
jgi:hypothetical protein